MRRSPGTTRWREIAWALLAAALASSVTACGACDTSGGEPIEYRGGTTHSDGLSYESIAVGGEYLHFPPGRRIDLMHELVSAPYEWSSFVGFEPRLTSNVAESAGNQVVVECADEERIRIRNDTCAEFYVRVVAKAELELSAGAEACR